MKTTTKHLKHALRQYDEARGEMNDYNKLSAAYSSCLENPYAGSAHRAYESLRTAIDAVVSAVVEYLKSGRVRDADRILAESEFTITASCGQAWVLFQGRHELDNPIDYQP